MNLLFPFYFNFFMAYFATLPDLIILNVLKYLRFTNFSTILDIHYCAICQRWRYLALPMAYSEMFIRWRCPPLESNNSVVDTGWRSNIGRYTTLFQQNMVKKVSIDVTADSYDFALLLGSMLEEINQSPIGWPGWHEYRIAGRITGEYGLVLNYIPQSLDYELLGKMRYVLEMFAGKFPNIMWLKIDLRNARGTAQQFTHQLFDIFYHKIQRLELHIEFPFNIEYFPPDLRRLYMLFTPNTTYPLPKIKSPEVLEKLEVLGYFGSLSWLDLIDMPADGSPIVFSRLKSLSLNCFEELDYDMRYGETTGIPERVAPFKNLQLQFPRLTDISLVVDNKKDELLFKPQVIPSRLRVVRLDIGLKELVLFSKQPIRSIGSLELSLFINDMNDMEKFYMATNRLLGEIDNYGNSTYLFVDGNLQLADIERTRWTNVTELDIIKVDASTLLGLIVKLPLLKTLVIERLVYSSTYKLCQQGIPQLTYVEIDKLKGDEWTLDNFAEFISILITQHEDITILKIPRDMVSHIEEMFFSIQWQHVILRDTFEKAYSYSDDEDSFENDDEYF